MEGNNLKLEITNEKGDVIVHIQSPINTTKMKKSLKTITTKKNGKCRVLKASWNGVAIETEGYFGELSTIDEVQQGSIELEKDLINLENVNKDELLDFMFDYVDNYDYQYLVEDYLENDVEDEILSSYDSWEIWDYLDWSAKEEIIYDYVQNTTGWYEIYEENTNNSEIMECLFQNTSFSPKEIIEKMQDGDTEDETE